MGELLGLTHRREKSSGWRSDETVVEETPSSQTRIPNVFSLVHRRKCFCRTTLEQSSESPPRDSCH